MGKISVIIPVFNMELFIKETILSVINQEGVVSDSLEILVINDGSGDGTVSIVKELAKQYEGVIKLIDLRVNVGALAATLEALNKATGEYICLLDADDLWQPDKLAEVISGMEQGYELVLHEGEVIDAESEPANKPVKCTVKDEDIVRNIRSFNGGIPLGSAISFKRSALNLELLVSVFEKFKASNLERYVAQDTAILHALTSQLDLRTKCIRKNLYKYRIYAHHSSMSSMHSDFDDVERLKKTFEIGLNSTLFAVDIYKASGLFYEDKSIEIGFRKFLYCRDFSLKEKSLRDLYKDYFYLLRNDGFMGIREKITKAIYPAFFRLPVRIRTILRRFAYRAHGPA